MRRLQTFYLTGVLLLSLPAAGRAQTATTAAPAADASAAVAAPTDQAPDDVTRKITDLVHAGKYAEAQQLTSGLLMAYPNDQRLIKAKALIESLLASSGGANAAAENSQPAANTAPLSGMDKLDYNSLIELARQAQQSTDLDQQKVLLKQFMEESNTFLVKHPEQMLIWQLRAASAISLNEPILGYKAGQQLIAAGAMDSNDPNLQQLLAKLKLLGWLDSYKVQELQFDADNQHKADADAAEMERKKAEDVKYTFPVFHVNGLHYEYGHLTVAEDEAIYVGTDETDHIARSDVRELKVACNADACGFYFTPKSGRRFFFLVVTEEAVANRSDKGKVFRPPAVLGNVIVARWGFVATDKKTLSPPTAPVAPKASKAEKVSKTTAPTPVVAPVAVATVVASATIAPAPPVMAEGEAVLHVYRPHHMTAALQKPDIYVDGKKIVAIANSQMVRMTMTPGKHNISVYGGHMSNQTPVNDFAMEAGGEYWIRVEISAAAFGAHLKLAVVPSEEAQAETKKMDEVRLAEVTGR